MMMKKGIVTLTALILLSGLLALILLFDEQIFAFFRSQMSQRKYYVEQSLPLQKISQQQKTYICQNVPLNGAEKVKQVFFESSGAEKSPIRFGVNALSYLRNRRQEALMKICCEILFLAKNKRIFNRTL